MANVSTSAKNPMGKFFSYFIPAYFIIPIHGCECILIDGAEKKSRRTVRDAPIYIYFETTGNWATDSFKCHQTSFNEKIDDIQMNAVRLHVSFWFNKTIPTLDKITTINNYETLPNISRTNLYRMLKFINFVYTKRSRNSALVEKDEIILWRKRYLADIRKYREEGRHIYYLDETWVNAGDCTSK
ncbi:DDE 3 domain-containing protein, partial [Aphis craccivora]